MDELEILGHHGAGYKAMISFESWRVAYITYSDAFDEKNITKMERHRLTDEVFILISGEATLIIGKDLKRYDMEKGKLYNVKKDTWHNIFVSRDACVVIVENDNTGRENSEYFTIV